MSAHQYDPLCPCERCQELASDRSPAAPPPTKEPRGVKSDLHQLAVEMGEIEQKTEVNSNPLTALQIELNAWVKLANERGRILESVLAERDDANAQLDEAQAKLNEYDKHEWFDIARSLRPGLTDDEYDDMWTRFLAAKAAEQERRKRQ